MIREMDYTEEVPRVQEKCTREEFRRTLRIIGGRGSYLDSPHMACRTQQESGAVMCVEGKWRQ